MSSPAVSGVPNSPSCKIVLGMAASTGTKFIEAKDLHKTYRVGKIEVLALDGVSFVVEKGEFVSVVGPSGSGKSTLFYLLGGLTRANSGSVVLDGDDFSLLTDAQRTRMRRRKIGFVFQKFNLLPTLGEQQRVALARALINKPAIVLADEPTGNLDSKNSDVVLGMLRQSNQELGQTVLMITHNPKAAKYGDRIIHMRDGRIVAAEEDPQWAVR